MKKTYVKPTIEYVNFRMSAQIAACARQVSFSNPQNCVIDDGGWMVFAESNSNCLIKPDMTELCYDVPTADAKLFSS